MRNLLTEVSKIKSMMGLKPNINEQSFFDDVNKIVGIKPNQNSNTFWDDVNKLTGISDKSQSGVVNAVKDGAKKIASAVSEKNKKTSPKPTGVSNKLVDFLKKTENFVECVYDDKQGAKCLRGKTPKGNPTIGYGTKYYPGEDETKDILVKPNDPDITERKAFELLKNRLNRDSKKILNLYPNLNQQQLDALTSLCYQTGYAGCTANAPNLSAALKNNPNNLRNVGQHFVDFPFKDRREKEWKIYSQGIYS